MVENIMHLRKSSYLLKESRDRGVADSSGWFNHLNPQIIFATKLQKYQLGYNYE